jgi:thiol-disulfide isomerase/thioredoxin
MKNIVKAVLLIMTLQSCDKQRREPFVLFTQDITYVKIITENITDTVSLKIETDFINGGPNVINSTRNIEFTNDSIWLIELKMIIPDIVDFKIDNHNSFTTYLIPADTLILHVTQESNESGKRTTQYKIDNEIFSYCQSKFQKFGYYRILDGPARSKWLMTLCTSEDQYKSLAYEADSVAIENIKYLEENKIDLPQWFVNLEKFNIIYSVERSKILFQWSLGYTNKALEDNLVVKTPLQNKDAYLSSDYYGFLIEYFHTLFKIDNSIEATAAVLKRLTDEYDTINTVLQGKLKNILVTSIINGIYRTRMSLDDISKVDSFLISNNFDLPIEASRDIDKVKMYFTDRLIDLNSLKSGNNAPDFELMGLDNTVYKLSQFKTKLVYIHFWATWCAPCLAEMPVLNQLITDLNTSELVVLNVCIDNEPAKWRQIIKDKGLQGLNLICDEQMSRRITSLYKISGFPHYALIDDKGLIIKNNCERPANIDREISQLMAEK